MSNPKDAILICGLIAVVEVLSGCGEQKVTLVSGCGEKTKLTAEARQELCGVRKIQDTPTRAENRAMRLMYTCERMCTRTFTECMSEVLVASGKVEQSKIELLKKDGSLDKAQNAAYSNCAKDCKKNKGVGLDAKAIAECLKMPWCNDYAACIKVHIK